MIELNERDASYLKVSKLVFYAQSTGMVISGRITLKTCNISVTSDNPGSTIRWCSLK